eukprot:3210128-Amphidinium_carterae.1
MGGLVGFPLFGIRGWAWSGFGRDGTWSSGMRTPPLHDHATSKEPIGVPVLATTPRGESLMRKSSPKTLQEAQK